MAKQLNLDEMLEIMIKLEHPQAKGLWATLEAVGTLMADAIAEQLGVQVEHPATFQGTAFAGTCAALGPLREGDPIPEALEPYDEGADWGGEWEYDLAAQHQREQEALTGPED